MKKSIRFVSASISLVMIIIILAGCSGGSSTSSTTPAATKATSETAATTVDPAAATKPVKIIFSAASANIEKDYLDIVKVAEAYTKLHPNVTFEYNGAEHDEQRKKIKLMAESNTLPDIFWESYNEMPAIAKLGAIADLTGEVNGDAEWKASFKPGALDNMTIDGKIYGIPQKNDGMGFFYNKALFDKFNLKIPETWDEFKAAIEVFNKNKIMPIAQGTKDTWSVWGYNLFFERYGYVEMHNDFISGKVKFNNPNMVKAYGRIKELTDIKAFPANITTFGYTQAKETFMAGKAAILTTGTWEINGFETSAVAKDIAFNWGPSFPDGVGDQKVGLKEYSTGFWVSANVKKDTVKWNAVIDFLKFRSKPEGTAILVEQANTLPATNYTGDISKVGPVFGLMLNALADPYKADYQLAVMNESSFAQPFWNSITGVMNGILTPEQAANSMDDWYKTK